MKDTLMTSLVTQARNAQSRGRRALVGVAVAAACIATSAPAASAMTPASGALPECATGGLWMYMGTNGYTGSAVYAWINFTNISGTTCWLEGFPTVTLNNGNRNAPIGAAAVPDTNDPAANVQVILAPDATAHVRVTIGDPGNWLPQVCLPEVKTTYIAVRTPGSAVPNEMTYSAVTCSQATLATMIMEPFEYGAAN